jgi:hypothetical protein
MTSPAWIEALIKIKDGALPDASIRDFDADHPIPEYLKGHYYFYSQGSSKSEVRRYFILPDNFRLFRYRLSTKNKRRMYFTLVREYTVKDLRPHTQEKINMLSLPEKKGFERISFANKAARKYWAHGINTIYLGSGPCPENDQFDVFTVSSVAYGHTPDAVQIRKAGRIYSSGDLCTKPADYWSSSRSTEIV